MPFVDYFKGVLPAFLRRPFGLAWTEAQTIMFDVMADMTREAIKARFLDRAPSDALPLIASDRSLERRPGESLPAWRQRLKNAWGEWEWGGTKKGVVDNLIGAGYPGAAVYEFWDWNDGDEERWARFWVVLNPPHGIQGPPVVGDGVTCGDGTICGVGGIDEDEFNRIVRAIRTWQSGHAHCEEIIAVVSGDVVGEDGLFVSNSGPDVAEGEVIYINIDRSEPR